MLSNWIEKFSKDLELETPITTEVPGVYMIPLEDDLSITIAERPEGLTFNSTIAPVPTARVSEFLNEALSANLFGEGTNSAVLGIDERGDALTLSRVIDYTINDTEFMEILEDFISAVDFWRDEALSYIPPTPT